MKIIDFADIKANSAKEIIQTVVNTYLTSLHSKFNFNAKLSVLTTKIVIVPYETIAECAVDPEDESIQLTIEFNPDISAKFNAFVIAHEFAHFLFANLNDRYSISGKSNDGSTNLNAVQRLFANENTYGYYWEELLANYLAHFIVSKLNYSDKEGLYETTKKADETNTKIVYLFESAFGQSLLEGNFIDEIFYDEDNQPRFNFFWNSIISFSFNNIVDCYDEYVGDNEFHVFCDLIDEYCERYFNDENTDIQEKEIFNKINLFIEKPEAI